MSNADDSALKSFECPLCNLEFEGAMCHAVCGMSKGCGMVRCPRCSYEFVQDGSVSSIFKRLFTRRKEHAASTR